jgi:integrase
MPPIMARKSKDWPQLYWRQNKRTRTAIVDCGLMLVEGKKKRVRYYFPTMEEARGKAALVRAKEKNEGSNAFGLSTNAQADAFAALALLEPHDKTLKEAAEFYLANIDVIKKAKPVREVVDELLTALEAQDRRPRYIKDLRSKLSNGFAALFGSRITYTLTSRELQDYVYGLAGLSGITRNNHQRALSVLFSFAVTREYALRNPAAKVAAASEKSKKPGILTVSEAEALLAHAVRELVPALFLGLLADLRPEAEIWRLDWSQVDLEDRAIAIENSKNTASNRFVRISDNLAAWIRPHAKTSGPVSPTGDAYHWRLEQSRKDAAAALLKLKKPAAHLLEWPQDALRHTFGSMHYAAFKNAGDTAEQMGHGGNLRTFFHHYRNRVKERDALAFWQILPSPTAPVS